MVSVDWRTQLRRWTLVTIQASQVNKESVEKDGNVHDRPSRRLEDAIPKAPVVVVAHREQPPSHLYLHRQSTDPTGSRSLPRPRARNNSQCRPPMNHEPTETPVTVVPSEALRFHQKEIVLELLRSDRRYLVRKTCVEVPGQTETISARN